MGIRDQRVDWVRERRIITPFESRSLITKAVNEGGAVAHAEGDILASPLDVAVDQFEVSNFGIVGVTFSAAGKILVGVIDNLYKIDPRFPIGFRVHWTNSGGASTGRGVTWILLVDAIKNGVAFAAATTALNTVITESLVTAAWANERSPRGVKNSLGLTRKDIEAGAKLMFSLEADVVDSGVAALTYNGLEIDFVPQRTIGSGSYIDRPTVTD